MEETKKVVTHDAYAKEHKEVTAELAKIDQRIWRKDYNS